MLNAVRTSTKPTPAIMACTMASPAKAVMADNAPVRPSTTIIRPPNITMERRSRLVLPMLPAITMVSAWNEMGATEFSTPHPTAPMAKPSAVGTEANP